MLSRSGLWEPYQIVGTPDEDINRWYARTLRMMQRQSLVLALFVCCTSTDVEGTEMSAYAGDNQHTSSLTALDAVLKELLREYSS